MLSKCLYGFTVWLSVIALLLSVVPKAAVVFAIVGTVSLSSSSSTSSGDLIVGPNKSLRSALGPLTLDYKSDFDAWMPGLIIREVTGNVGIGTLSPSSKLDINGVVEAASIVDTSNPSYYLDPANVVDSLIVAGNVGIGKTNPSAKLDVSGNIILGDNSATVIIDGTNIDISSAGAITLSGNLTLSSGAGVGIDGGGLTDCAGSTSKLLWSSSTKQFSCGTDENGSASTALVEKDADETVNNSNSLQDDDHLKYTMAADTAYAIEMSIHYTSPTGGPDFRYAFTIPAGASMNLMGQGFTGATAVANCRIIVSGTACVLSGSATPDWTISVIGIVQTAGTPGDFQLQWAQNSATAVDTVVKKNSWMKVATLTGAADLAEIYETDDPTLQAGHIVSIASRGKTWVTQSSVPYDPNVIGVVSTKPFSLMGNAPEGGIPVAVALTGRVPIRIDPDSDPITPGDFLASSRRPGLAKKATEAGYAVAKALDSWKPHSTKNTVEAILMPGFVHPNISETLRLQNERIMKLEEKLSLLEKK